MYIETFLLMQSSFHFYKILIYRTTSQLTSHEQVYDFNETTFQRCFFGPMMGEASFKMRLH